MNKDSESLVSANQQQNNNSGKRFSITYILLSHFSEINKLPIIFRRGVSENVI